MGKIKSQPESEPIEIVDLDEAIEQQSQPFDAPPQQGVRFWFGEVGVLKFNDGTSYHITKRHATITDPTLIANLTQASETPNSKIFIQS